MSKSRHRYDKEADYGMDEETKYEDRLNKQKEKRLQRALKTKNIEDLMHLDEDEDDYYYDDDYYNK